MRKTENIEFLVCDDCGKIVASSPPDFMYHCAICGKDICEYCSCFLSKIKPRVCGKCYETNIDAYVIELDKAQNEIVARIKEQALATKGTE